MERFTVKAIQNMLSDKQISAAELFDLYSSRIADYDQSLNAFITTDIQPNAAYMSDDQDQESLIDSALTGIPYAAKDIFCTQGIKTTCGSKMLENFIPPYDATVVRRLKKQGAVLLGKTNMDEFAMGSSNETSYFGSVHNPWDIERTPGGSSGGSAAAVAAGLAPIALGTDTGGSIRQPAAFTGITGLKPTYGRCSRYGMVAFASSLDQAGILALSAEDTAIFLESMAGFDPLDSTSVEEPVPQYSQHLEENIKGKIIGLPKEFFDGSLGSAYEALIAESIDNYKKLGIVFKEISLPNIGYSVPTYYVVAPAECSSNLARYDGVRFGYRSQNIEDLDQFYRTNRQIGFGQEVKRRIITGTYVLSTGYYDAYYLKAQKVRQLINQDFARAFESVDIILGPTTQTAAFKLGEKIDDPVSMYMNDIYTISANLAGLPAISHPIGFVDDLPYGLQLIAPHFKELNLLNLTHQYQKVTDWHQAMPRLLKSSEDND